MRWITKRPEPRDGDTRVIRRFAWFPTRVGGHTVWLESYGVEQRLTIWSEGDIWVEIDRHTLDYYC